MAEDRDAQIGENLAEIRNEKAMSQAALAGGMRERGWKWSQSTVWSVERGDRPMRLAEAFDVAEILKADVLALARLPEDAELARELAQAEEHRTAMFGALEGYLFSQSNVKYYLALAKMEGREYSERYRYHAESLLNTRLLLGHIAEMVRGFWQNIEHAADLAPYLLDVDRDVHQMRAAPVDRWRGLREALGDSEIQDAAKEPPVDIGETSGEEFEVIPESLPGKEAARGQHQEAPER